jgi:hypothetical protein
MLKALEKNDVQGAAASSGKGSKILEHVHTHILDHT